MAEGRIWRRVLLLAFIAAIIVVADQGVKLLVDSQIPRNESRTLLGDFIRVTHVRNPGVAFGIRLGGRYFYTALSVVAVILLFGYAIRLPSSRRLRLAGVVLILGGALGNLLDRLRLGAVVDFLDIGVTGVFRWPSFNVADAAVTIGVLCVFLSLLTARDRSNRADEAVSTPTSTLANT